MIFFSISFYYCIEYSFSTKQGLKRIFLKKFISEEIKYVFSNIDSHGLLTTLKGARSKDIEMKRIRSFIKYKT